MEVKSPFFNIYYLEETVGITIFYKIVNYEMDNIFCRRQREESKASFIRA